MNGCFNRLPRVPALGVVLWVLAVSAGMGWLWSYSASSGRSCEPSASWPDASPVEPLAGKKNLVLLLHPRCPCSFSTVNELARIRARSGESLAVHALFFLPEGESKRWAETRLWESVATIPGVNARIDRGGREAIRFGGFTSGAAILYDENNRLVYHGGLTGARSHEGDNPGSLAVLAELGFGNHHAATAPVFGCDLLGDSMLDDPRSPIQLPAQYP